jgi:N-methylhydantoinase B
MRAKGKQFVPHGRKVVMAFPGGAGYGDPADRPKDLVKRDLARGYISAEVAARDYGLSSVEVAEVEAAIGRGENL